SASRFLQWNRIDFASLWGLARYPISTQSSSGGSERPSHRIVSALRPFAHRAAGLLPASRSALTATARSIGVPFQSFTITPFLKLGSIGSPQTSRDITRVTT